MVVGSKMVELRRLIYDFGCGHITVSGLVYFRTFEKTVYKSFSMIILYKYTAKI